MAAWRTSKMVFGLFGVGVTSLSMPGHRRQTLL
jgi:hypothetical protein